MSNIALQHRQVLLCVITETSYTGSPEDH